MKIHDFALVDQDWIGLMIFKNFADQDWIGFNFIGSGQDSDWKISQSAHLWLLPARRLSYAWRENYSHYVHDKGAMRIFEPAYYVREQHTAPHLASCIEFRKKNSLEKNWNAVKHMASFQTISDKPDPAWAKRISIPAPDPKNSYNSEGSDSKNPIRNNSGKESNIFDSAPAFAEYTLTPKHL